MDYHKFLGFVLACILLSGILNIFLVFAVDSATEASTAIGEAEAEVLICYKAAAEANRARANVSGLLKILDEAGTLLSKAYLAYESGDYGLAVDFANQSKARLNGVVLEANGLRDEALQAAHWDFMVNVVGSSMGTVAVVCGGFAVWFFFKKRKEDEERV